MGQQQVKGFAKSGKGINSSPRTEKPLESHMKFRMNFNLRVVFFPHSKTLLLACEQAPSEPARSEKNSASEERDSASEASGTRGSL